MNDTGRISRGLKEPARRIVFGDTADHGVGDEMPFAAAVDEAHLVMLAARGIIHKRAAARLLREIGELRDKGFAPLKGRRAPRGLYMLYERHLMDKLGPDIGGVLQTARSRNDLNATVMRLRLRPLYADMLREVLRLQAVLLRRARRHADVVMPAYTHYQAAIPVTLGHYFLGIASARHRGSARTRRQSESMPARRGGRRRHHAPD
jgi:argininosuccinate lyase